MHLPILSALVAGAVALSAPAFAAGPEAHAGHGGHEAKAMLGQAALTEGLVKKVDQAAGSLTLTHGPLPNGMPGMTMAFKVKDPAWLDKIKVGQSVRFAIDDALTITRLEAGK